MEQGGQHRAVGRILRRQRRGEEHYPGQDGKGFPVTEPRAAYHASPSWAADSRGLYFVSDRDGARDLWRQRISGDGAPIGAPARVTTGVEMQFARFSPDGDRLTYAKGRQMATLWQLAPGTATSTSMTLGTEGCCIRCTVTPGP